MTHHATITMSNAASIRILAAPIRQRVKVAGVEVDAGSPFVRVLHRLYASVLDAETRAEACRVALDDMDDTDDEAMYLLTRQAWLTAQARALGVRQAFEIVRDEARKAR